MVLVTGATGLVGSHLLAQLVKEKQPIRAMYRTEAKRLHVKHILGYYFEEPKTKFETIDWVKADITDIPSLDLAFNGVTHVYHCAAYISFDPKDYYKLRKVNIEGTANIVNFCISKAVKKLCHVSSVATLGKPDKNNIITEDTNWNPEANNHVYGITKYGGEMEVWRGTQEGLDAVIVKPGVILGGGFWKHGSGSLFKRVYNGISRITTGTIGLVDVEDVALIMKKLMTKNITNQAFIVVANTVSFKQFIGTICKVYNKPEPNKYANKWLLNIAWRLDWLRSKLFNKRRRLTKHLAKSLMSRFTYDNTKIKTSLNYTFKDTETSIRETANLLLEEQ